MANLAQMKSELERKYQAAEAARLAMQRAQLNNRGGDNSSLVEAYQRLGAEYEAALVEYNQAEEDEPVNEYKDALEKANAANEARYQEALGKLTGLESLYGENGTWGKGVLAEIESQKRKDVASGTQNLVQAGLANSTVMSTLSPAWEQNVGSKARLNLADLRTSKYSDAVNNTVNLIASKTDAAPDATLYANLLKSASTGAPQSMSYTPRNSSTDFSDATASVLPATQTQSNIANTINNLPDTAYITDLRARQSAAIQEKAKRANAAAAAIRASNEQRWTDRLRSAYQSKTLI